MYAFSSNSFEKTKEKHFMKKNGLFFDLFLHMFHINNQTDYLLVGPLLTVKLDEITRFTVRITSSWTFLVKKR